jgi:predicted esterase
MHAVVALALISMAFSARADEPPRRAPSREAEPATAFAWTSKDGLRFTWVLPKAAAGTPDLIVLCHGTGLDYRWGSANYKPGVFRPADIVVSVDGPTQADNGTRLFLGQRADADAFAAFLAEMRAVFHPAHVLLYGHSQGSFFVCYFLGEHPDLVDGVVAHASGVWTWTRYSADVSRVPIVLMHGTADPVVPYAQSAGGRDWYIQQGHSMVQLRRLPGYNHWPNGDRASECLDWCIGMGTDDPARALATAESVLRLKGRDEYGYESAPWFSGAMDVLRRFQDKGPRPFAKEALEKAGPALMARASALAQRVEAAGAAHAAKVREQVKSRDDLKLDGRPWLGHLLALREDFRGVEGVEALARELGLDAAAGERARAAGPLLAAWHGQGPPAEKFRAAAEALPACFLYDGLPADFGAQMERWFRASAENGLGADAGRLYGAVARWRSGRDEGLKEYGEIWSAWSP